MKKLYRIIISSILLVAFTSCSGFLDRYPNQLSTANFYQTDQEAEQAANSIFAVFYNFFQNHVGFDVDCLSDDALKGHGTDFGDYNSFNVGQIRASDGAVNALWSDYYQGIFRANVVLEKVSASEGVSTAKKNQVLGEAHFLRAYFYFQLVQRYGGVPIVKQSAEVPSPARATAEEVYQLIHEDLDSATEMLSYAAESAKGRPNKGTAICLNGITYLSQNNFEKAYETLKPVVNNEGGNFNYALIADLKDMYQISNNNGPESVLEIQSRHEAPLGQTLAYNHWVRPRGMSKHGGLGFLMPTQSLVDEFEPGDPRLEATVLRDGDFIASELVDDSGNQILFNEKWSPETGYSVAKYVKWVEVGDFQERHGQNKKLIRYAEVLLAYAEAAYGVGQEAEAWKTLDIVRQRAMGPSAGKYDPDFTTSLRHERRVELATENKRYFDIVRWGIAEDVLTPDCKKHKNFNHEYVYNKAAKGLYPIPQRELDVNDNPDFKQNPGY